MAIVDGSAPVAFLVHLFPVILLPSIYLIISFIQIRCSPHPVLLFDILIYHLRHLSLLGCVSICCLHRRFSWCLARHLPLLL